VLVAVESPLGPVGAPVPVLAPPIPVAVPPVELFPEELPFGTDVPVEAESAGAATVVPRVAFEVETRLDPPSSMVIAPAPELFED